MAPLLFPLSPSASAALHQMIKAGGYGLYPVTPADFEVFGELVGSRVAQWDWQSDWCGVTQAGLAHAALLPQASESSRQYLS